MAFDISDQSDLTALKNEIENDPASIGYNVNSTNDLVEKVNSDAANTTGATVNKPLDDLTVADVSEVVNEAEFTALGEYDKEWVKALINQSSGAKVSAYKGKFLEVFASGSATRTSAQALLSTPASRAEELFGYGTKITRADWIAARGNG